LFESTSIFFKHSLKIEGKRHMFSELIARFFLLIVSFIL